MMNRITVIYTALLSLGVLVFATSPACVFAEGSSQKPTARCEYYLKQAQSEDDALSMSLLGDCYVSGDAGAIDHQKAEYWYRESIKAAPTPDFRSHAQLRLAIFLVFERGSQIDRKEGSPILDELANENMTGAKIAKGLWLFMKGSDPADEAAAVSLILDIAEEGEYATNFLLYGLSVAGDARLPIEYRDEERYWGIVYSRLEQEDATEELCGSEKKLQRHWMWRALSLSKEGMNQVLRDISARLDCQVT